MKSLSALFNLQCLLIKNQIKKKQTINTSKTIYIVLFLLIPLVLFLSFGYSIGFLIKNPPNLTIELNSNSIIYSLSGLILMLVISNIFSKRKMHKQITFRNLRHMPINLFLFLSVDLIFSYFNKINLFLFSLLFGLVVGLTSSKDAFFFSSFLIVTLILFIHVFVELIDTIINTFKSRATIAYIILGLAVTIFILTIDQSIIKQIINATPISLSITIIVSFSSINNVSFSLYPILYNIAGTLICLFGYFLFKWLDLLYVVKSIEQNSLLVKLSKKTRLNGKLFDEQLSTFLLKDMRFFIRSSRIFSQIFFEILLVIIFVFSYYYNLKIFPHNLYFTIFISIAFPVLLWDFYLSNQWGVEKKGFGFYLFAPIKYNKMIFAKNLGYFFIKIPVLIISVFLFGFFISADIIPFVIFLQIIVNLLLISIANYNSVNYAYPVDISENILSQNTPNTRFSMIGFLGLLLLVCITSILLFFMWKLNGDTISLILFIVVTLFSILSYLITLKKISNYFVSNKENMYISLRSNE